MKTSLRSQALYRAADLRNIETVAADQPLMERAGLAAGDEWLGIETPGGAWRLQRLDDLPLYAPPNTAQVTALVARDQRLLRLPLQLSAGADAASDTVQLRLTDPALAARWLSEL